MMNDIAIRVEGLGKQYHIGGPQLRYRALRDTLANVYKAPFRRAARLLRGDAHGATDAQDLIWALKDISLEIKQGEAIGIIGRNGAGKTTLLKVLSRITEPTEGSADIYGRLGSLLEVGTGFHPELSGRDNIYLNGAILGMRKQEISRKFDEIVEFSGIPKFIDTPVKHYSSGMYTRLAFSVAAHLETEILLVDEVLAVGDAAFQKKCLGKMDDVVHQGRTVLLVSHNMEAIMGLCSRAVWLNNGYKEMEGPSDQVVKEYLSSFAQKGAWKTNLAERTDREGEGLIRFTGFRIQDTKAQPLNYVASGETVDFIFSYVAKEKIVSNVTVWFRVFDSYGRNLLYFSSRLKEQDFPSLSLKGEIICRIPRFPLRPDKYTIDLNADVNGIWGDRIRDAAVFEVVAGDFFGTGRTPQGEFFCDHSWGLSDVNP